MSSRRRCRGAELGRKYMKKSISVVTLFPGASQCYAGQIRELFGDLVEVYSYSTSDQSVEKITRTDLYLVSTDAFKIAEEESQYVPADGQVVEIYVGYSKEVIRRLKEIPAGTRVLFVNVTHQMAREAITQLEQSGVNQLQFIPYGPDVFTMEPTFGDDVVPENVKLAVTPDEMDFVPAGMEQVINIGHRPCTANTMIETALRLGLESVMEEKKFQNYIHSMASGNYSFEQMFQRSRNLESQLDLLLEILDEGVIGVNEKGKIFACNQKARVITGMKIRMLLGRPAEQIFPYIPFEKCIREQTQVLERLIRINAANINMTVVPVMRGGRCIGAFSTLQPLSELEKKQNELRSQLRTKGYRAKYNFEDVVGKSQAIEKTKTILKSMAQTESPILLIGETGTGKEMFAQSIHNASPRRNGPFVAINCTALNRNLLESELFGYADSSFTGARKGGKAGLFETAHGGTIFLDEIGVSGTVTSCFTGKGSTAGRGRYGNPCGYPCCCSHQPQFAPAGGSRKIPNGSVLPVECSKRGRSSAPKSGGGLSGDCRSYLRSTDAGAFERGGAGIFQYFEEVPGLSMAGKCPGTE